MQKSAFAALIVAAAGVLAVIVSGACAEGPLPRMSPVPSRGRPVVTCSVEGLQGRYTLISGLPPAAAGDRLRDARGSRVVLYAPPDVSLPAPYSQTLRLDCRIPGGQPIVYTLTGARQAWVRGSDGKRVTFYYRGITRAP